MTKQLTKQQALKSKIQYHRNAIIDAEQRIDHHNEMIEQIQKVCTHLNEEGDHATRPGLDGWLVCDVCGYEL